MCDQDCRDELKADLSSWVLGKANISVSTIGILMNIFGLYVFRRIKNQHSFHKLIICLTIVDTLVLLLSILDGIYRGVVVRNEVFTFIYPYFIHPCFYICICCSIYLTICISHERYTALKDPVRYSNTSMHQTNK